MLRSAASPGSRGVRPVGGRYEWPPHDTATDRPPRSARKVASAMSWGGRHDGGLTTTGAVRRARGLFDFAFAEFDVLFGNRIVFFLHQLVSHGARILAGDVVEARIRAGDKLYLDGGGLRHGKPQPVILGAEGSPRGLNVKEW